MDIQEFSRKLDKWYEKERKRLLEDGDLARAGVLNDKVETLRVFLSSASTVGGLIQEIEQLFQDNGSGVTLSTIHKAKGMEWERVFILDAPELMPCKWASNLQEELNLCYVAATRAQKGLIYVCSDGLEAGEKA